MSGAQRMLLTARGTVLEHDLQEVLALLRSIVPENGQLGEFREYERVYASQVEPKTNPLRIVRPLKPAPQLPSGHVLRYLGRPDARCEPPCLKRLVIEAACTTDPAPLLECLGCTAQHKLVRAGWRFATADNLQIEVFEVLRLPEPHDLSHTERVVASGVPGADDVDASTPRRDEYYVIEASVEARLASSESAKQLQEFMSMLEPKVQTFR